MLKTIINLRRIRLHASIGLLSLTSLYAFAGTDGKTYHGAMCKEVNNKTPKITYHAKYAQNSDTVARTWICPGIVDQMGGSSTINEAWVTVDRHGSTAEWVIKAYKADDDADEISYEQVTVPAGDGKQTVRLCCAWYDSDGTMSIYTSVPAGARIYSYRIDEYSN